MEISPNPAAGHQQSCGKGSWGQGPCHLQMAVLPSHCSPGGASVAAAGIFHSWSITVECDSWVMSFFSLA